MKAKICLQKETDIDKWSIAYISIPLFSRSLRLLSSEKITGNSTEQMAKYIYLNLEFNNQTCESINRVMKSEFVLIVQNLSYFVFVYLIGKTYKWH